MQQAITLAYFQYLMLNTRSVCAPPCINRSVVHFGSISLTQPKAMGNGTLLTMIARFLLHGGYRAIFMSQKKLFQLCHFISQQGDFILEVKGKTFSLEANRRSSQSSQKSANIRIASSCFSEELCRIPYNFITAYTEIDFTKCMYFFTI